jgi:large subunit ribosomal protein L14e
MMEVGRIVIKLAGRDAGREAVIVDILDDKFVLLDGNVRRRKCNVLHLEPTDRKIDIKKGASHENVENAFNEMGFGVWKTNARKVVERPRKIRKKKKKKVPTESKTSKADKEKKIGKKTDKNPRTSEKVKKQPEKAKTASTEKKQKAKSAKKD